MKLVDRELAFLRAELARNAGIFLDERADEAAPPVASPAAESPDDRAAIREVIVAAGAPATDLEWLVASCPSVDAAEMYRPPARDAWCVDCGGPQPTDASGCRTCRERTT